MSGKIEPILKELANLSVYVGVSSKNNKLYDDDDTSGGKEFINTATLAAIHEFGSPERNIPERSFLRKPLIENKDQIAEAVNFALPKVLSGQISALDVAGLIGEAAKNLSVTAINSGLEPVLKQSTIKHKGSSTPLIDTGQLKGSIDYEVRGD